ncbi:MAG: glycosyltransferase, partial [Nanoarchaeota archaeon]|nr:glycosyltransferase [Nanoarchaeota archaeon]
SAKEWFNMSYLGKKTPKIKGMHYNDYLKKRNKKTWQKIMSEMLDIDTSKCSLHYKLTEKQKKFASDFARRYNLRKNDLIIGLNTGSGEKWPSKNLSVEKTSKLAEKLYNELKAKIILFGGPNEIERNNEIIAKAKVPIINTGCGNDLFEFPSLISLCHLFITSDTLGMHLAIALKRKVVVFFGPTSAEEIELFNLGKKIISKHPCYCCYKLDCKADEAYSVEEIFNSAKDLLKMNITIIVTAFKEPLLGETIKSILRQKIDYPYEILVSAPDKDTLDIASNYAKKYKQIKIFKDPGKGKSYALNLIFNQLKGNPEILVLTDGDVILGENSINEILNAFREPSVGCATGRIISSNPKNNKYGFWSHLLADAGAHKIRKELHEKDKFLECSGYLFAFKNNFIEKIPLDVAEDSIIPYYFWKKGYKIAYSDNAKVYVKNPSGFEDWLKQRKRTAKAHETLTKYAPDFPRIKSFKNEASRVSWALQYPRNAKEFFWTIQLIYSRFYMWLSVFYDTHIQGKHYTDAWERVESTKI